MIVSTENKKKLKTLAENNNKDIIQRKAGRLDHLFHSVPSN